MKMNYLVQFKSEFTKNNLLRIFTHIQRSYGGNTDDHIDRPGTS
jgi:hypothetical protein